MECCFCLLDGFRHIKDCWLRGVHSMGMVYIVCGGPSLQGFDFSKLKGKDVIVVNKSIMDVPWAKYFVTMDFTFLGKVPQDCLHNEATKIFIANFAPEYPYMKEHRGRIIDSRMGKVYDLAKFDVVMKSRNLEGLGFSFKDFRSGENSGFCAFQLAVLLGYKSIHLLGVDLVVKGDDTHYHGGYGGPDKFKQRLPNYVKYWQQGVSDALTMGIGVISHSRISVLNALVPYENL